MNEYKLTSKHIQLYADHLRLEEKGAATIEKYLRDVRPRLLAGWTGDLQGEYGGVEGPSGGTGLRSRQR